MTRLYCELYGLAASTTMGVGRHSAELWPITRPADAMTEQALHDGLISLTQEGLPKGAMYIRMNLNAQYGLRYLSCTNDAKPLYILLLQLSR